MASRYSKVQSSIWKSKKFNAAKAYRLEYMYLLTCPHGNSAGLFFLPEGYAIDDMQCSTKRFKNSLDALKNVGLIDYDGEIILIRQFLRWNPFMNPKHARGTYAEVSDFITSPLYSLLYEDVKRYCKEYLQEFTEPLIPYTNSIDTVSKQYREGISTETNTETETETNTETETIGARAREGEGVKKFIPPSLDEVQEYAKQRNSPVNAKDFWEYFDTGKWIDSEGKPVRNWKQKFLTWENKRKQKESPPDRPINPKDYTTLPWKENGLQPLEPSKVQYLRTPEMRKQYKEFYEKYGIKTY